MALRAACGVRASPGWPGPRSRSPRPSTRWPTSDRSTCCSRPARRSPSRSCATWTRSATSARPAGRWRSAATPTARSSTIPTTSRPTRRPRSRPPSCRSPHDDFDHQLEQAIELMEMPRDRRDPLRHQRAALAHARRDAGARRDGRGAQPVVGRRGVGEGGPRHRPARGRVDDLRLPAPVRPARSATSAASTRTSAPTTTSTRAAPSTSTRRTASSTHASSGRAARDAAQPVLRARGGARRGVLRRPRLGAAAVVRVERRAVRPVPEASATAPARVGRPLVVADHQRRAPGDLRDSVGMVDLTAFNEFDIEGPARSTAAVHHGQLVDVAVGRSVYTPLLTPGGGSAATSRSCASARSTSA